MRDISAVLSNGIAFLAAQQQADGSFLDVSSADKTRLVNARTYHTTFFTSLILDCLCSLDSGDDRVMQVRRRAAAFLLAQKNQHWSWNYWSRVAPEYAAMPYPDDLDDTFCALAALARHDPSIIDGVALAQITSLLTASETEPGGPYRTWLMGSGSGEAWRDVDVAVNSNVAYFLRLQNVHLAPLASFLERAMQSETLVSPYYPSWHAIAYFVSRSYDGAHKARLTDFILSEQDTYGAWGDPLHTALAVSALARLGTLPELLARAIEYLMHSSDHGVWPWSAFCIDPVLEDRMYFGGSAALTTALCLESLVLWQRARESAVRQRDVSREHILTEIMNRCVRECEILGATLQQAARKRARIFINYDDRIALLPLYFARSLREKAKGIPDETFIILGLANLYGWIAYDIFDDVMDNEGDASLLPLAIFCSRRVTLLYGELMQKRKDFMAIFVSVMNALDAANAWEQEHARIALDHGIFHIPDSLPDFGTGSVLAEKSLGHALGPVAILCLLGFAADSLEVKSVIHFFTHYLIARQLNDDAHDWADDMQRGYLTSVGVRVVKLLQERGYTELHMHDDLPVAQELFWRFGIDAVAQEIDQHSAAARACLEKLSIITDQSYLLALLLPLEQAARKAVVDRTKTLAFLKHYPDL